MGFDSTIRASKDVEIIKRILADFDRSKAQNCMSRLLTQGIEFDGIFAHNDNMILGILDALSKSGYDKPVVSIGFDALPEAVQAVSAGRLHATIAQQPKEMGWIAVREIARLFRGETLPEKIEVALKLIEQIPEE